MRLIPLLSRSIILPQYLLDLPHLICVVRDMMIDTMCTLFGNATFSLAKERSRQLHDLEHPNLLCVDLVIVR